MNREIQARAVRLAASGSLTALDALCKTFAFAVTNADLVKAGVQVGPLGNLVAPRTQEQFEKNRKALTELFPEILGHA